MDVLLTVLLAAMAVLSVSHGIAFYRLMKALFDYEEWKRRNDEHL